MNEHKENPEIDISEYEDDSDVFNFGKEWGIAISKKEELPDFDLFIGIRKGAVLSVGLIAGIISGSIHKNQSSE